MADSGLMNGYFQLERLANDRIRQYRAEADLERLRAEARQARVDARRGPPAGSVLRFLCLRIRRNDPPVLSLEKIAS